MAFLDPNPQWLPIVLRVEWILMMARMAPFDLSALLSYSLPWCFCSCHTSLFAAPWTHQAQSHLRAFVLAISSAWNAFPSDICKLYSFTSFRNRFIYHLRETFAYLFQKNTSAHLILQHSLPYCFFITPIITKHIIYFIICLVFWCLPH